VRKLTVLIAVLMLALAACGGAQEDADVQTPDNGSGSDGEGTVQDANDSTGGGDPGNGDTGTPTPEPSGTVDMNTIRIGSDVWSRTLPMTTGQCFLYEDDGNLPTSATVWGTLNGDDDLRFMANFGQDGTFEAEISNDVDMYWIAGERAPDPNDLSIELDFASNTITGSGTFYLANTGELASGSFAFQCDGE
jgi:hypothetical protein